MLRYAEIVVHHYAKAANSIVIRFHSSRLEITLKFDNPENMTRWKRGFDYALELYKEKIDQVLPRTLHLVSEHLLRQHDPTSSLCIVDAIPLSPISPSSKIHEIDVETKYIYELIDATE